MRCTESDRSEEAKKSQNGAFSKMGVTTKKEKRCSHHKVEIYCGECVFWGKQADKHKKLFPKPSFIDIIFLLLQRRIFSCVFLKIFEQSNYN